ncbi:MAG: hypothetical protein MI974_32020 [Chitinophagales bacterium]|nr:hypothetical protein [Chitinophagales bacterium]
MIATMQQTYTPTELAKALDINITSLQRRLNNYKIKKARDEHLSKDELTLALRIFGKPHGKRPIEVTNAAQYIAENLGIDHTPDPDPIVYVTEYSRLNGHEVAPPPIEQTENVETEDPENAKLPFFLQVIVVVGVLALLFVQSNVYAEIAYNVLDRKVAFIALFIIGYLIDGAGIVVLYKYRPSAAKKRYEQEDIKKKQLSWIVGMAIYHAMTEFIYIDMFGTWTDTLAKVLIGISVAFGLFVYSHIFLRS